MSEGTFDKLREQLSMEEWPNVYFFKFIVPNTPHALAQTTALFDETARIQFHESSYVKFFILSVKEMMLYVVSIIDVYEKAQVIPGIISL